MRVAAGQPDGDDISGDLAMLKSHARSLLEQCSATNDTRGVADALGKFLSILDATTKVQSRSVSTFEAMTIPQQVAWIRANQPLHCALFDDIVRRVDAINSARAQEEKPGQRTDSTQ
ncbi:MAG: hypothetical protein LAN83_07320 [Acidobacteriia bacterium]|nr:hypothetical protein [Terriglobia bacterium]